MAYLKVNKENKTITIDTKEKATPTDDKLLKVYIELGYDVRIKSEKRAEAARKRAKENGFGKKKKVNNNNAK